LHWARFPYDMASVTQIGCEVGRVETSAPCKPSIRGGYAILAASCAGCCLAFVSGAVINVALAAIGRELYLGAHALQWVLNAEVLPLAALTLVGGAVGDRLGQRPAFLLGISVFTIASLACGLAQDGTELICGRFLQGAGEAVALPTGLTILGQAFSSDRKGLAVGLWSASAAVASAIAPAAAGWILDEGSWRWVFMMQVPLGVGAFVLAAIWVPRDPRGSLNTIDLGAAALSVIGLGGLGWSLMAVTAGDARHLAGLVGGVVTLMAFVALIRIEVRKGGSAMLPPGVFAGKTVFALSVFTALLYGAFTTTLILIPFAMIKGAHMSALLAGVAFLPLQVLVTAVSPMATVLCARFGHTLPLVVGALVMAAGCAAALKIGVAAQYWADVFPAVTLIALGISLVLAPMTTLVLTSVEARFAATAAGFNGAVSRVGSLSAIALLGQVLGRSGGGLMHAFHIAMVASAGACLLAALVASSIPASDRL
jgi:MFS family permease